MSPSAVYGGADQSDILEADAKLIATNASETFEKYALFSSIHFPLRAHQILL